MVAEMACYSSPCCTDTTWIFLERKPGKIFYPGHAYDSGKTFPPAGLRQSQCRGRATPEYPTCSVAKSLSRLSPSAIVVTRAIRFGCWSRPRNLFRGFVGAVLSPRAQGGIKPRPFT